MTDEFFCEPMRRLLIPLEDLGDCQHAFVRSLSLCGRPIVLQPVQGNHFEHLNKCRCSENKKDAEEYSASLIAQEFLKGLNVHGQLVNIDLGYYPARSRLRKGHIDLKVVAASPIHYTSTSCCIGIRR